VTPREACDACGAPAVAAEWRLTRATLSLTPEGEWSLSVDGKTIRVSGHDVPVAEHLARRGHRDAHARRCRRHRAHARGHQPDLDHRPAEVDRSAGAHPK
jgi:hypothetical protein